MDHMYLRIGMLLMVVQMLACASGPTPPGDPHDVAGRAEEAQRAGSGGTAPASECHWPSDLAPLGTQTRDTCIAARAYLSCSFGGGGVLCPSNDAVSCADPVDPQFQVTTCTNTCGAHEYVAICGGIGPGAVPEPPAGCHAGSGNPGGSVMYCCPCESSESRWPRLLDVL
jgi:hypothetical protein